MEFTFVPIQAWPGLPTLRRRRSTFRASYNATLRLLDMELRSLEARNVVLQVALPAVEIRIDGKPFAGARPREPGVILSFDSKHGPLSYPCDTYDAWEDNLRAIALGLENLRAVDRYGVTRTGEQYRGWKALAGPTAPTLDRVAAVKFLQQWAGKVIGSDEEAKAAYRKAAFATHPDRGGDPENFKRVQQAKEVLGL